MYDVTSQALCCVRIYFGLSMCVSYVFPIYFGLSMCVSYVFPGFALIQELWMGI